MNKIWQVECRHSTFMHLAMPSEDCENPISVIHSLRGSSDPDRDIGIYGGHINTNVVRSVELTMLREDFEDDYFNWGGVMFASEKLRNVMALDAPVVNFLEVDDSKSAALPRSKRYQIMQPLLEDDVSDKSRSRYSWQLRRSRNDPRFAQRRRIRPRKGDVPPMSIVSRFARTSSLTAICSTTASSPTPCFVQTRSRFGFLRRVARV